MLGAEEASRFADLGDAVVEVADVSIVELYMMEDVVVVGEEAGGTDVDVGVVVVGDDFSIVGVFGERGVDLGH